MNDTEIMHDWAADMLLSFKFFVFFIFNVLGGSALSHADLKLYL